MRVLNAFVAGAGLLSVAGSAWADAPTPVRVGVPPARMRLLVPAVHRYVRYSIKDGRRSTIDIWTRKVAYEPQAGIRRLHLTQEWDRVVAPPSTLIQDSWFDAGTLAPLTHVRRAEKGGVTTVSGYRFAPGAVVGMAELPENARRDFRAAAPEASFNFEYDMELLQVLPWRRGYVADIVFYDPGLEPPAHYLFREAGEVKLMDSGGRTVDCWLVTADYNTGHVLTRFWLDKRTQLVIHEESERDGVTYVKTLVGAEAADASS